MIRGEPWLVFVLVVTASWTLASPAAVSFTATAVKVNDGTLEIDSAAGTINGDAANVRSLNRTSTTDGTGMHPGCQVNNNLYPSLAMIGHETKSRYAV